MFEPLPWRTGETIVVRYRLLGTDGIVGARPLRFIGSKHGYVAGWLPGGAEVATPVLAGGRPLRSVPAAEWFTRELSSVLTPWRAPGILMLVPRRGAHSIWLSLPDDGSAPRWYVNLEQPHRWHGRGCDTRDDLLDLTCDAPRRWSWKDEDELECAVAAGVLSTGAAGEIRAEGQRVARSIERWESPFRDGWERWRADPGWPTPELPCDWSRP